MVCPCHMGGLGTELDVQVTDGDLGHGVCVTCTSNISIYYMICTNISTYHMICTNIRTYHMYQVDLLCPVQKFWISFIWTQTLQYEPFRKHYECNTNIAFARGGAHLPIAHALRLLSTKELRFGLTKLNLRKNNFLK